MLRTGQNFLQPNPLSVLWSTHECIIAKDGLHLDAHGQQLGVRLVVLHRVQQKLQSAFVGKADGVALPQGQQHAQDFHALLHGLHLRERALEDLEEDGDPALDTQRLLRLFIGPAEDNVNRGGIKACNLGLKGNVSGASRFGVSEGSLFSVAISRQLNTQNARREENCFAEGGGGWHGSPFAQPPPLPLLGHRAGRGVWAGAALPAVPGEGRGGGGPTPTHMPQNDPHVALIILTTHMWGKMFS